MEISVNIAQCAWSRPLTVIVGHERSGNYFLMNAIAEICGCRVSPCLDLDHNDVNINFHDLAKLDELFHALCRPSSDSATHLVNQEDRMRLQAWIDQQMLAVLFAK